MVRLEKQTQAFKSLQSLLIWTRWLAYQKEDFNAIADIMDWAEYLAGMLAEEEDRTETYAAVLKELADKYPFCNFAVVEFAKDPIPAQAANTGNFSSV